MKAKKSSPKSIRFNISDFEEGMTKGKFQSAQEMVDFLLKNYVEEENVKLNVQKTIEQVTNIQKSVIDVPVQKELSKAKMFKLMREGKS